MVNGNKTKQRYKDRGKIKGHDLRQKHVSVCICLTSHKKSTESDTETNTINSDLREWHQLLVKSILVLTYFFSQPGVGGENQT